MEFVVRPKKLNDIASDEKDIRKKLNKLNSELEECKRNLQSCLSSSASPSIGKAISSVHAKLRDTAGGMGSMGDKLETIAGIYAAAEADIAGNKPARENIEAAKSYDADGSVKKNEWGPITMAKKASQRVFNDIKNGIKSLKDSYDSHGFVYYAIEYGKAALKVGAAAVKMAGALTVIMGTFGFATVPAICALVSGMNDVWNATSDVLNIYTANYDQVGKTNGLKSAFQAAGEKIGGEAGSKVGSYMYYGVDVVGNLFSLADSVVGLKNMEAVNAAKLGSEMKGIGNAIKTTKVSNLFNKGIRDYELALAKYAFPETGKLVKNTGLLYKMADKTKKTIESGYALFHNGEKTDAFDGYNNVSKQFGKAAKGYKAVTNVNTYVQNFFYKPSAAL